MTTTDVVQVQPAGGELATLPDSVKELVAVYRGLDPRVDIGALIQAATGADPDEPVELRRKDLDEITIPDAKTSAFTVPDDTEEDGTRAEKKLQGIIVGWFKGRGYWRNPDITNSPPDCTSWDNKVPVRDGLFGPDNPHGQRYNPDGTCKTCPMSNFGSARDAKGRRGRGQACKEQMAVLLLMGEQMIPVILRAAPTSLDPMRRFMLSAALKRQVPFWGMEVEFTLVKDRNAGGQEYNKLAPKIKRVLDPNQAGLVKAYREAIVEDMIARFTTNPESMALAAESDDGFDDAMYGDSLDGDGVVEDGDVRDEPATGRRPRTA